MMRPPLLRRLSRDELAFHNLLAQRRAPIEFEWLGDTWRCELAHLESPRDDLLEVRLDWGGAQALLRVDAAWIDEVASRTLDAPLDRRAPETLVVAMLEAALGELADSIEDATHKRLRILGTGRGSSHNDPHGLAWRLERGQRDVRGELWVDALGLGFLAAACKASPAASADARLPLDDLPVPLRFALGQTDIDLQQLRRLHIGDVVLMDECWLNNDTQLVLRAGDRQAFDCTLNATTLEVVKGPRPIMSDSLESHDEADAESLGDLPVRLSFDLGARTVTLRELQDIGAGHVFDMGRELRRAVHIRANGKAVGEGELVEIDGRIGVAVTAMRGTSSHPADAERGHEEL